MNTRAAVAAAALLLAGCPSGPDTHLPPEIDLSNARRLEAAGKVQDAIVEHARLVDELNRSGRTDARARVAWGRILESLRRLRFHDVLAGAPADVRKKCGSLDAWRSTAGPAFLSAGAAGHWAHALSIGAEPAVLAEAAGAIAGLLAEKLDDRPLRRGGLEPEGDVSDRLYRRFLAEAAADYAVYAVKRAKSPEAIQRAAGLLRRLGRELRGLASLPGVRSSPSARWSERAVTADAAALALEAERDGAGVPLDNDLRQAIELDANGLLKSAVKHVNKANDLLSRRAAEEAILDSLELALRNFAAGRECLVEPSPVQKRELNVMAITADTLRAMAFER